MRNARAIRRLAIAAGALAGSALAGTLAAARADDLVFLSTQLRPIESAQAMRNDILKGFSAPVTFVTEVPPELGVHVRAEAPGGKHVTSVIGALHGELMPLAATSNLAPLDALAAKLADRGIAPAMMDSAKLGTPHTLYIPWMQATYIMAANKKALPYLPAGADINHLSYAQLAQWGANIEAKTGKRMIGFPAGPQGLMPRFFEGYLYPSFTGGVVRPFRSADAETMWTQFRDLWKSVNPNSTNYAFMQEPLMSGEVWIAWDHVARLIDALAKQPDDFVAFPVPAGPKGRGYMPVVAGLAVAQGAPDAAGAENLIEYLTQPDVQIRTARSVAFFPVVKATLPADLPAGLRMEADTVQRMEAAPDALVSLLPIGLDQRGGEFDKVFMDTFQLIVLRGEAPRRVLDREGDAMRRIMTETKAPCWKPDAPSQGACPVD